MSRKIYFNSRVGIVPIYCPRSLDQMRSPSSYTLHLSAACVCSLVPSFAIVSLPFALGSTAVGLRRTYFYLRNPLAPLNPSLVRFHRMTCAAPQTCHAGKPALFPLQFYPATIWEILFSASLNPILCPKHRMHVHGTILYIVPCFRAVHG